MDTTQIVLLVVWRDVFSFSTSARRAAGASTAKTDGRRTRVRVCVAVCAGRSLVAARRVRRASRGSSPRDVRGVHSRAPASVRYPSTCRRCGTSARARPVTQTTSRTAGDARPELRRGAPPRPRPRPPTAPQPWRSGTRARRARRRLSPFQPRDCARPRDATAHEGLARVWRDWGLPQLGARRCPPRHVLCPAVGRRPATPRHGHAGARTLCRRKVAYELASRSIRRRHTP